MARPRPSNPVRNAPPRLFAYIFGAFGLALISLALWLPGREGQDQRWIGVLIGAVVPCLVTAYGFTLLTGKGAQLLIGTMLMLTVPLRYTLRRRQVVLHSRGLVLGAAGYGAAVGGTVGAGVILLSLLMAAGLTGSAVIATDAMLSIIIGVSRLLVFGFAGALTAKVIAFALLIGVVAFPGAFLAKAFVARMPLHVHTAVLDAVVLFGGAVMVFGAVTKWLGH